MKKNMPKQRREALSNRGQVNAIPQFLGSSVSLPCVSLTSGQGTVMVWGFLSLAFAPSLLVSKCHFWGLFSEQCKTITLYKSFPWLLNPYHWSSVCYNKSVSYISFIKDSSSSTSALIKLRPQTMQSLFWKV